MIDIHCHILPGVDDGASNMDQALELAEIAVKSGVDTIVATPHCNLEGYFENYETERLKMEFRRFQETLQKEQIPLTLLRGAELYSTRDLIEVIDSGKAISLNGSRYYLMEFGFDEPEWVMESMIIQMLESGRIPVIAHPERYFCVQDHPEMIYDWTRLGALFQINKGSVLGAFGERCERTADILLDHGLVTCIASDAHKPHRRTTDMEECSRYIARHYSEDYCHVVMHKNPLDIIQNRELKDKIKPLPFQWGR